VKKCKKNFKYRAKFFKQRGKEKMEKLIPLSKQSKKERRKFYSSKRGSWNGISPVTRVVRSRKVYDRKRMKSADRRACAD